AIRSSATDARRRPRARAVRFVARFVMLAATAGTLALLRAGGAHAESASTECNAYFPLRPGARWVYTEGQRGSPAKMQRTITVKSSTTHDGVTDAGLMQEVTLPGEPGVVAGQAITK